MGIRKPVINRNSTTAQVVAWRRGLLQAAGFPHELAELIACDPDHDIHALLDLVDRGCPPELAVRITASTEP